MLYSERVSGAGYRGGGNHCKERGVLHCRAPHSPLSSLVTQGRFTAGIIAILWQFGLEDLAVDLKRTNGVYQTWNLLSLCQDLHTWFGNLNLWFKATDEVRHSEDFPLALTDYVCSPTAIGSVFLTQAVRSTSAASPIVLRHPIVVYR